MEWHLELDAALFKKSLEEMVAKTDSLQLIFSEFDQKIYQRADERITAALEIVDYSEHESPVAAATAWLDCERSKPFDLHVKSFTTALVRCGPNHWIWQLNQHHIASDFLSNWIMLDRLDKLYRHGKEHQSLPELEYPSFLDHIAQLEKPVAKLDDFAANRSSELVDICPILERDSRKSMSGSTQMHRIDIPLGPEWTALTRSALGLPPTGQDAIFNKQIFDYFLAATVGLTSRLSGSRDVPIGIPTHNRYQPGTEDLTGLLMRMVPVQYTLDDNMDLKDLCRSVGAQTKKVLSATRAGDDTPIFPYNVIFNYIVMPLPKFANSKSVELTKNQVADSAGLDLSVRVRIPERNAPIFLSLDVNQDIIDALGADVISTAYTKILHALFVSPSQELDHVALSDDKAFQHAKQTSALAYAHPSPAQANVPQGFCEQAVLTPLAVAASDGERSLTYQALEQRSLAVAHALCSKGIGVGSTVAIALPRSIDLVVAMMGVMRSGATYCVIETELPLGRQAAISATVKPALYICETGRRPGWGVSEHLCSDLPSMIELGEDQTSSLPPIQPETPMYYIFTSGSTGEPKGICVPHGSFGRYLSWAREKAGSDKPWSWALASTASFEIGYRIFVSLVTGGTIHIYAGTKGLGAMSLVDAVAADEVDFISMTPSMLRMLTSRKWTLSRLSTIVVIGERFPTKLALEARVAFGPAVAIQNWYGPTETVMATAMHIFDPDIDTGSIVPIGKPAPDATLHILDSGMNPLPPGIPGEIFIGGQRMSLGYVDRPDLMENLFIKDPFCDSGMLFRSGDIGWRNKQGNLICNGRKDDLIKINGERVHLNEIQLAVQQHPQVQSCTVIVTNAETSKLGCAYASLFPIPEDELRKIATNHLGKARVPSIFRWVAPMPLNANGKINASALRRLFDRPPAHQSSIDRDRNEPPSVTEAKLTDIWCKLLDVASITPLDDFFDLGGDSLSFVRMILNVEQAFLVHLPLEALGGASTISQIMDHLSAATKKKQGTPSHLRQLRPGDPKLAPIIMAPLSNGSMGWSADLIKALDLPNPIYGFTFDLDGQNTTEPALNESLISAFLNDLEIYNFKIPLCFVGFSFGGTLSGILAAAAEKNQFRIGKVIVLDSYSQVSWMTIPETQSDDPYVTLRTQLTTMTATAFSAEVHLIKAERGFPFTQSNLAEEWAFLTTGFVHEYNVDTHHNLLIMPPFVDELSKVVHAIITDQSTPNRSIFSAHSDRWLQYINDTKHLIATEESGAILAWLDKSLPETDAERFWCNWVKLKVLANAKNKLELEAFLPSCNGAAISRSQLYRPSCHLSETYIEALKRSVDESAPFYSGAPLLIEVYIQEGELEAAIALASLLEASDKTQVEAVIALLLISIRNPDDRTVVPSLLAALGRSDATEPHFEFSAKLSAGRGDVENAYRILDLGQLRFPSKMQSLRKFFAKQYPNH